MSDAHRKRLESLAVECLALFADAGVRGAELRMLVPQDKWPFDGDTRTVRARTGELCFVRTGSTWVGCRACDRAYSGVCEECRES